MKKVFTFLAFLLLTTASLKAQVLINEISPDPANADGNPTNRTGEFIELYNAGAAPVDISGWILADGDAAMRIKSGTIIAAGGYYLLSSYGLNSGPGGSDPSGISCDQCDFKGITVEGNWGPNATQLQLVGNQIIGGSCATPMTPAGSPDCGGDGNKSENWLLLDAAANVVDAVYWGTNNPCGVALKVHNLPVRFTQPAISFTVPLAPFDGSNSTVVAAGGGTTNTNGVTWKYAGGQLNGCNSSYQRIPDGSAWASGNLNNTTLSTIGTFTTGAQPTTQPTNHPTPKASNTSIPFTFSVAGSGLTLVTAASDPTQTQVYQMCAAAPVTFTYVVNNYQSVQPLVTYANNRVGSFITATGAGAFAPAAWSIAYNTPTAGQTTLTYTFTPPAGTTNYQAVWEDFIVNCCGGGSLSTPTNLSSCAWECYESRRVQITVVPPMTASKTSISCPGDFTEGSINIGSLITGGGNKTYTLSANNVTIATNNTGIFTLPSTLATPLSVLVTDASGCTAAIPISINENCRAPILCPSLVLNTTTTTAAGALCPAQNIDLCINLGSSTNLPHNGTVEWYKGSTANFDPYKSPASDFVCSSTITNIPGCPTTPATTSNYVKINRVIPRPLLLNGGGGGEYMQIVNLGPCPVDIGCWGYVYASSAFGTTNFGRVPSGTIIPCGGYYEFAGSASAWTDVTSSTANGGSFYLFNASGTVVQSLGYGWFGTGTNGSSGGTASVPASGACGAISVVCPDTRASTPSNTCIQFRGNNDRGIYRNATCNYASNATEIVVASAGVNTSGANTTAVGGQCAAAACSNTTGTYTVPCCSYTLTTADCNAGPLYFRAIVKPLDSTLCTPANATTAAAGAYTVTCPVATFAGGGVLCNGVGTPTTANLTITSAQNLAGYTVTYLQNGSSVTSAALTGSSPYNIPVSTVGTYEVVSLNAPLGSCNGTISGSAVEVTVANPPLNFAQMPCTDPGNEPVIVVYPSESLSTAPTYTVTSITPAATLPAPNSTGIFILPVGTTDVTVSMNTGTCATSISAALSACPTILPVEGLDFTAKAKNGSVLLSWQHYNATMVKQYQVLRGSSAINLSPIATIDAKQSANHTYSFTDKQPLAGISYYRLKVEADNGTVSYSPVQVVELNKNGINISYAPNPTSDKTQVNISTNEAKEVQLQLVNQMGALISVEHLSLQKNSTTTKEIDLSLLPVGIYYIRIDNLAQMPIIKY